MMRDFDAVLLTLRALFELLRYDLLNWSFGFKAVEQSVRLMRTREKGGAKHSPEELARVVVCARLFYFRRVRCLQNSVATVRFLRSQGWPADLVIGFQRDPFLGHAWVELKGKALNESSVYRQKLSIMAVL
jgi:hypothetical protein